MLNVSDFRSPTGYGEKVTKIPPVLIGLNYILISNIFIGLNHILINNIFIVDILHFFN